MHNDWQCWERKQSGRCPLVQQHAESQRGLLAQGWMLPRPELTFGTDNILPLTSSQSLNLSNLTSWFVFLFKVGVIVLVAAVCLRCAGISGLNLVKTCQAEVGHKCSKNAAFTEIPSRRNLLVTLPKHKSAVYRTFPSLSCGRQNNTPILEASKSYWGGIIIVMLSLTTNKLFCSHKKSVTSSKWSCHFKSFCSMLKWWSYCGGQVGVLVRRMTGCSWAGGNSSCLSLFSLRWTARPAWITSAAPAVWHGYCFPPKAVEVRVNYQWKIQLPKLATSDLAKQDNELLLPDVII